MVFAGMNQPNPQMIAPLKTPAMIKGSAAMPRVRPTMPPPHTAKTNDQPSAEIDGTNAVRAAAIIASRNQRTKNSALNWRNRFVKLIVQAGHGNRFVHGAHREDAIE